MLASNFPLSTEAMDIAEIGQTWPGVAIRGGRAHSDAYGWRTSAELGDVVTFCLSSQARPSRGLVLLENLPRAAESIGLTVFIPTAGYLLALKLRPLRVARFGRVRRILLMSRAC